MMPPPANKPFALPDFVLDVADSSIALATPFGPVGFAIEGNGKLSGGFAGRAAIASPRIAPGRCAATNFAPRRGVCGRAPSADRRAGHRRQLRLPDEPVRGRCAAVRRQGQLQRGLHQHRWQRADGDASLVAGANGLANFVGDISYKGALNDVAGRVKLSAQKSRMGDDLRRPHAAGRPLSSERHSDGTFDMAGNYAADSARARAQHVRRRHRPAGRGRQDSDRAGRDQHRQCRASVPRATSIRPAGSQS